MSPIWWEPNRSFFKVIMGKLKKLKLVWINGGKFHCKFISIIPGAIFHHIHIQRAVKISMEKMPMHSMHVSPFIQRSLMFFCCESKSKWIQSIKWSLSFTSLIYFRSHHTNACNWGHNSCLNSSHSLKQEHWSMCSGIAQALDHHFQRFAPSRNKKLHVSTIVMEIHISYMYTCTQRWVVVRQTEGFQLQSG